MACTHENATITFYEEQIAEYELKKGVVTDTNDDSEPQPLAKVDIRCPDCALSTTFPNWHQLPEPLLTYCRSIRQREYGFPPTG